MSNSKQLSLNLNPNICQKKRKTSFMSSRPLTDAIVRQIVSNLSLTRKLELRSVSKQFKTSIDNSLAEEESIQFVDTYGKDVDVFIENYNKNRIDLNKIGHNFDDNNHSLVQLLAKLKQIRRLEFDNNVRITNESIDWILKRYPNLSSLSLTDYRCNYLTFDWMAIGDKISENLVCLQIECRLNQQILAEVLADVLAKLNRLEELTIVCPRRRLNKVFSALPPNLIKLRITYCLGLYYDEIMALIDGNGRQLQVLEIHYQMFGFKIDQNKEFALICANLSNLRSLSFNHLSLSIEALAMVSYLNNLETFRYNYSGCRTMSRSRQSLETIEYDYKYFDFKLLAAVPRLRSMVLSNVELRPQMMYNWTNLFPNIQRLFLKSTFVCGCQLRTNNCPICMNLCFTYLSELKCLRSLDFGESFILINAKQFIHLEQIDCLSINCHIIEGRNYLLNIFPIFITMAKRRNGRPLVIRLYDLRFASVNRINELEAIPKNLKLYLELSPNSND